MVILDFIWDVGSFIVLTILCIKFLNFCSELRQAVKEWCDTLETQQRLYTIWINEADDGN